jgi:hypothetical protein
MALILDGSNGITFPSGSVQNNAVANNAAITALVGSRGLSNTIVPAGTVLQVVSATYSTQTSTTTNGTFIDTGLTASITPLFSTSKILVLLNHNGIGKSNDNSANDMTIRLYRGATLIATPTVYSMYTATAFTWFGSCSTLSLLDSPATTSSTTYKTQFNNSDGGGTIFIQQSGATSTLTLMEIAQ